MSGTIKEISKYSVTTPNLVQACIKSLDSLSGGLAEPRQQTYNCKPFTECFVYFIVMLSGCYWSDL